jgi:predicted transcriptional regulator
LADHTILAVNKNSGKKIYITKQDLRYNLKSLRDEKIIEAFKSEKEYTLEVMLKYFQYFMANKGKIEFK